MMDDYLKGVALDGSVSFMASWREAATGRWRRRRVSLADLAAYVLAQQAARDAAQDDALSAARSAQADRDAAQDAAQASEAQARQAGDVAEASARSGADTAQAARLAALEARPEEVVPFTASLTIGALAYALAVPGILASDRVSVEPAATLPGGISIGAARVTGAGQVEVTLVAGIALTGSRTIPLTVTALR